MYNVVAVDKLKIFFNKTLSEITNNSSAPTANATNTSVPPKVVPILIPPVTELLVVLLTTICKIECPAGITTVVAAVTFCVFCPTVKLGLYAIFIYFKSHLPPLDKNVFEALLLIEKVVAVVKLPINCAEVVLIVIEPLVLFITVYSTPVLVVASGKV